MSNGIGEIFNELIDTGLSSIFDPNPVNFKHEHEKGVVPLRRLLSRHTSKIQRLPRRLVRNAFLCGCLDFTENEPIEYLIVGYGVKRGVGTDIYAVQHVVGNECSVSIPDLVIEDIDRHSTNVPQSEIIIFHNHPYNWLNAVLDNVPLPSTTDRRTMLQKKYMEPFQFVRFLSNVGGVRFYLGENGFVNEIRTPSITQLLKMFDQI
ncbi:MAG: hypothetical protein Q8O41_04195 [Candidatus Methanoperedens sp.]|nr:hypothetical protein [Candidatus Methanoperedens sp.]